MVPIEMLRPGMRVKIVDQWVRGCCSDPHGGMDKYLGKIVTVLNVKKLYACIEEDAGECPPQEGGHWYWSPQCFDYIVEDESEDFEPASDREMLSFLFGGSAKVVKSQ